MQKLGEVYKHMNLKLVSSELFVRSCERFSHSTKKKRTGSTYKVPTHRQKFAWKWHLSRSIWQQFPSWPHRQLLDCDLEVGQRNWVLLLVGSDDASTGYHYQTGLVCGSLQNMQTVQEGSFSHCCNDRQEKTEAGRSDVIAVLFRLSIA